jgi:hypothetical protein
LEETADANGSDKGEYYRLCSVRKGDVSKEHHKMGQITYKLDVLDSVIISPYPSVMMAHAKNKMGR